MTDWADEKARDVVERRPLEAAIAAAMREERERCAKVCDAEAAKVRARGRARRDRDEPIQQTVGEAYEAEALVAVDLAAAIRGETP